MSDLRAQQRILSMEMNEKTTLSASSSQKELRQELRETQRRMSSVLFRKESFAAKKKEKNPMDRVLNNG